MDNYGPDYNYEIIKVNKTPEEQARILEEQVRLLKWEDVPEGGEEDA